MILFLLLAATAQPIDPRITFPWELTVYVEKDGKTYIHTEPYRNQDLCEEEHHKLEVISAMVPAISVSDCDYVGLT